MIFYFSATGNSLYAAQTLAEAEQAACISIADVMRREKRNGADTAQYRFSITEGESVGFVLPTYFCGVPSIVAEFLSKLHIDGVQNHYVFLVLTYGAMDGNAAAQFQKMLTKKGLSLSAAFSVCMIDTYLPMFSIPKASEIDTTLAKADVQLADICAAVQHRQTNTQFASHGLGAAFCTALMYPSYQKGRKTSSFTVSDACTGCGLCEKVCPCGAIRQESDKPLWVKSTCVLCLGCLHRCPAGAIDYGKKTLGKQRYVNQRVTIPDKFL